VTDMRATERLLEVIEENATAVDAWIANGHPRTETADRATRDLAALGAALDELRRRGDTLVRRNDLELVVQAVTREQILLGEDEAQSLARLDGALGGA
jgi:hypothetical protein